MVICAEVGQYYSLMDLSRWEEYYRTMIVNVLKAPDVGIEISSVDIFFRYPEEASDEELEEWREEVLRKTRLLPIMFS